MKNKLTEGVDYYFNKEGLMVLTENYHIARGYCCGNGCRHCPYNYREVREPLRGKLLAARNSNPNDEK